MGVVSHSYCGCRDGCGGWYACRTKAGGFGRVSRNAGALPKCEVKTLMTNDQHRLPRALGRVKPKSFGLPCEILARDASRRLRFVVHAADWLHSVVLHGRS